MSTAVRWLPLSGRLAAVAFALTGLISPPLPTAGESVADGIGATLLVVFASTFRSRIRTFAALLA